MRRNILCLIYSILYVCQYIFPQEYVIKFKFNNADSASISYLLSTPRAKTQTFNSSLTNFSIKKKFPNGNITKSKFPWNKYAVVKFSKKLTQDDLQVFYKDTSVEYIQQINEYSIYSIPDDSAYASQWNLNRIGIKQLYSNDIINTSLPAVIVGVIDTGIDPSHPDLSNVIFYNAGEIGVDNTGADKKSNGVDDDNNGFIDDWEGYNFINSNLKNINFNPIDENGHGTAVSGIIGAQTNNGIGLAGISGCKILPLQAFNKNGIGLDIDIASAIVYAVDNGAEVLNMSFGDVIQSPILLDAIRYAFVNNVVLIASSGNDGSNFPHYPSDFNEVISIGSVNKYDAHSIFSSHSPSLDLVAPGEQIVTTTFTGGYTNNFSGTSAAAPHVSGVVALMKSIEHQKKDVKNNYHPLTNEEIRGILLNSADDVGDKGWDELTASGVINAGKALNAVMGINVSIESPKLDEIILNKLNHIILTASTPYLQSVHLYYGRGEEPTEWISIAEIANKILMQDTIEFNTKEQLSDDVYILRLLVKNSKGNDIECKQRIYISTRAPSISSLKFTDSIIVGNEYGILIEARTDRNTYGNLFYRRIDEQNFSRLQSLGLQKNHAFVITSKEFTPGVPYLVFCEFVENSSLRRSVKFFLTDSIGSPLLISSQIIPTTGFTRKDFSLPSGFLLNTVLSVNSIKTVVLNEYDKEGNFGNLKAYGFNGGGFVQTDSVFRSWIPRTFCKANGNILTLVQEHGTSQLIVSDTISGKLFHHVVWSDSLDIWASNFEDLDGDDKPEIIARNSSEYLIYKNLGNNTFALSSHLSNPTSPLTGEAKNQFGPPKALVGDFTGSGMKEIIVADYDGDIILYRQDSFNSLNFSLAGIDTSDLYEMSDFITTGDFNGDGILDFAIAGHSNLDWNNDREYDSPVWTVKVFSHLPTNSVGAVTKIWEQHFAGVNSGLRNDNGLTSGKFKNEDRKDALFISFNPNLYVFTWDSVKNIFVSKWIHHSESNSVIIHDFDGDNFNEFGFHTNDLTEFWSVGSSYLRPQSPWNVSLKPVDSTKILIQWNSSNQWHHLYRGIDTNNIMLIATINGTSYLDSTVSLNIKYYYFVTAFDTTESNRSLSVSVVTHYAPTIKNVSVITASQLSVQLSYNLSSDNLLTAQFLLDSVVNTKSIILKSNKELLLSFTLPFDPGNHSLQIRHLLDATGMEADTSQIFQFNYSAQSTEQFFVRSVTLISQNRISVEFNEQPNLLEAMNSLNYEVKTITRSFPVLSVAIDSTKLNSFILIFDSNIRLNEIALRLEITFNGNITSETGMKLMDGKGQVFSIAQEAENLENIVVYPNPVKQSRVVSFVNIPAQCQIFIFTLSGKRVKKLDQMTTSEGVNWNLKDENGVTLPSGIYLYRVEKLDDNGSVVQTHLGKFAVIH